MYHVKGWGKFNRNYGDFCTDADTKLDLSAPLSLRGRLQQMQSQVEAAEHSIKSRLEKGLRVLMGYRYPGDATKAAVELFPVVGKKVTVAASEAGLADSSIPALLAEGDDRPGLAQVIAEAISGAQVNMTFFVAQTIGRKFSAALGFETEADAKAAAPLIKKAAASKRK